ncbi:MAG: magnesium transporter [Bacteroidota bacterium]|nr:magnesium transporter [Bacteroidota bacterium]MEC8615284.1 magnesium transporter [Bacteroidota bacterium]|tara:strand:+ start:1215 stop:2573 length:1359 start_codon:yes stop_codon:yes gene_type:complete
MQRFKIDENSINKIRILIEKQRKKEIIKISDELHFADIAEILNELSIDHAIYFVKNIESEKSADALAELNEDLREKILEKLSPTEIANEIEELDTDDAADMIAELSSEKKEKVMSKISDSNHLKDIKELLTYSENTAGAIMAKELVKVKESLSVLKCIDYMRAQAENVTRVHSIYVVDNSDKLLGRLSLKDLLTVNSRAKVKDIYIPKVDFVYVNQSIEETAKIMSKYDLEAIPVVSEDKILLGRITIDDIVDIIKEEANKDYQLAAGISNVVEADDGILQLTKARLPWLILGLIGGLGAVFILQDYEEIMNKPELRTLFFYTPLIAAMAGNVGIQSSAIIVQGIANDNIKGSLMLRLFKETGLSLINGIILSLILILFGFVINQELILSLTVSISMIGVIIIAALVGTFIPIILNKRGIDPAIATGPFITTANDIFGIFLFFYFAKSVLNF